MCHVIGFEETWVDRHCLHPMATVTANFYPKVLQEGGWRVGAHTDFGTITVLDRDTDNGLQVEVALGRWKKDQIQRILGALHPMPPQKAA